MIVNLPSCSAWRRRGGLHEGSPRLHSSVTRCQLSRGADDLPPWPDAASNGLLKRPVRPELPADSSSSQSPPNGSSKHSQNWKKPQKRKVNHKQVGGNKAQRPAAAAVNGNAAEPEVKEPPATSVLGVDFGTKWTGLAVGANSSISPLQVIPSGSSTADLAKQLTALAVERELQGIVVGLPINPLKGNSLTDPSLDTPIARRCRELANTLAVLAQPKGIQVYLYDEASTSLEARQLLGVDSAVQQDGFATARDKQKHKEDAISALLLVRRYLNKPGLAVRVRLRATAAPSPAPSAAPADEA